MKNKKIIVFSILAILVMTTLTINVFADNKTLDNNKGETKAINASANKDTINPNLESMEIEVDGKQGIVHYIKPTRINGGYCKRTIDNCFLNEGYYLIRGRDVGSTVKITDENGNIIMENDVDYEGIIVYAKTNYVIELNDANADRIYLNE